MALPAYALRILAPYLRNAKVLCLGHPDILATPQEIEEIFGVATVASENTGAIHDIRDRALVATHALFDLLGSTLDCVDIYAFRGTERIVDLNEPQYLGEYDLVIDPGTIEHCFNIGQAVMNAANAVKAGGRIYHSPPLSMLNHGFYNICPTMLWDFYEQNGWRIELMEARRGESAVVINANGAISRKGDIVPESSLICMAHRRVVDTLRFPVQKKYLLLQAQKEKAA